MTLRLRGVLLLLALTATPVARPQPAAASGSALFDRVDPLELRLELPLQDLFEKGTNNEHYSVTGTLSIAASASAPAVVVRDVQVSVRGNTSKRETECSFPKLKLKFRDVPDDSILKDVGDLRVGTHCGEARGEVLTQRFGRLANERATWREALVYRIVDAVGVPTLKARPARFTYVETGNGKKDAAPLTRNAMLLEDDNEMKKRLEADEEVPMEAFGNARDQFSADDSARLAFAQAMIGNFDWCLRFSADDTYRCDQRKPLWNVLAFRRGGTMFPVLKDFDLAGPVTGEHPWFADVYNKAFVPSKSAVEIEVLSQAQRTRALFPRDVLDRTRRDFLARRDAVQRVIDDAAVDDHGRDLARQYTRAFYEAIATDAAFYRRVVARPQTHVYADAAKTREACGPGDVVPVGTPVNELRSAQSMTEVLLLDAMWRWSPPADCEAVHNGTVWVETTAIDTDYPPAGGGVEKH